MPHRSAAGVSHTSIVRHLYAFLLRMNTDFLALVSQHRSPPNCSQCNFSVDYGFITSVVLVSIPRQPAGFCVSIFIAARLCSCRSAPLNLDDALVSSLPVVTSSLIHCNTACSRKPFGRQILARRSSQQNEQCLSVPRVRPRRAYYVWVGTDAAAAEVRLHSKVHHSPTALPGRKKEQKDATHSCLS